MNSLDSLAAKLGVEESFVDAKGEVRATSPETKRALLSAMGISSETDEDAAEALRSIDDEEWGRALRPVCVSVSKGEPVTMAFVVPEGQKLFNWQLEQETGERHTGSLDPATLAPQATHTRQGRKLARYSFALDAQIPHGYHKLRTDLDDSSCLLIVTPGSCWLPKVAAEGRRLWGVAAQLYLLQSQRNWGIGDFSDLRVLVDIVKQRGGDVIGLNPLHSLFLDDPERASPYSPESRLLLNVLNIDLEAVPELAESAETQQLIASDDFQKRLAECRAAELVNYTGVAELKKQALKLLFECCRNSSDSKRWKQFEGFRKSSGPAFEQSCLFEALRQHFAAINGALADWHSWPPEYRDVSSPAVQRFAEEHAGTVTLFAWMQWLADEQLGAAAHAAKDMEVGLYRDLAVGTDMSGASTWRNPDAIISEAHVGAPPDIFNPAGQDWGLPPFHPRVLFESGYGNFIDLVRANMRHARGLRIDHVMALQHLYWVPKDKSPRDGAYVKYPMDDLIGIIALESHRQGCLVVGEDLGTVPEGFRERMAAANILSYRVLFFEQDSETGVFAGPEDYPRLSLAVSGSHDLPTVRGWWKETDIALKKDLGLFPTADGPAEARERRDRDKQQLLKALRAQGLLGAEDPVDAEDLIIAVHAYLAKSQALIAMIQVDDITAETDPVNVPSTSDEHPNWRRRLSTNVEGLRTHPRFEKLARVCNDERSVKSHSGHNR